MIPRKTSIGGLLSEYERRQIRLPEFQRPYSWEKAQFASFWGDLIAFRQNFEKSPVDASYFLGALVAIESKIEITILDGQQRLATATILLAALRDLARRLNATSPHQDLDYFARDVQRELTCPELRSTVWSNRQAFWRIGPSSNLARRCLPIQR